MSAPVPKLVYFAGPGRAQGIRLLFAIGGVEFEDVRLSQEEFAEKKAAGEFPYGQVPVLIVGDRVIAQSVAIGRYAAKLGGLYPFDPLDAARVDSFVDLTGDISSSTVGLFSLPDEEKDAFKHKLVEETFPRFFNGAERQLEQNAGPFVLGSRISLADVWIFRSLFSLSSINLPGFDEFLARYPRISALRQAVADHPAVRARYNTA